MQLSSSWRTCLRGSHERTPYRINWSSAQRLSGWVGDGVVSRLKACSWQAMPSLYPVLLNSLNNIVFYLTIFCIMITLTLTNRPALFYGHVLLHCTHRQGEWVEKFMALRVVASEDCPLHGLFSHLCLGSILVDPNLWSVPYRELSYILTTMLSASLYHWYTWCLSELYFQEKLRS
jgi:hypothetical protein